MIRTNRRFLTNVIKSSTGSVKNHIAGEETFAYQPLLDDLEGSLQLCDELVLVIRESQAGVG